MVAKTVRFVSASELSGATPGRPGGIVAVAIDDFGQEIALTAAQYREQEHEKIRIFDLWHDVRFLSPDELHPDDYRALYPKDARLPDKKIHEILKRVAARYRQTL